MNVKGEFATDDVTGRRRMASLEVKKRLAKEESEGLGDEQEGIYLIYQNPYFLSLQAFLSLAL